MANDKITVDGIAFYAKVFTPDTMANAYVVDLVVSDEQALELEAHGLSAAKDRAGNLKSHAGAEGKVFKFKRKVLTRTGIELGAPVVADSDGNTFKDLIGNGSKVRVHASLYSYKTPAGVEGTAAGLNAVQIIDLVKYEGSKSSETSGLDKIEGGFVAKDTSSDTGGEII